MQPQLQGFEVESLGPNDDDLAIENALGWQLCL